MHVAMVRGNWRVNVHVAMVRRGDWRVNVHVTMVEVNGGLMCACSHGKER